MTALVVMTPVSGAAQDVGEQAPISVVEEPTRVSTVARSPMEAFDVGRSENVVTDEEIRRRQAKSVTDALDEETGILVQSTNRGAGTVILRGLVGPENLIVFDGVRFSQSTFRTGPNQYLDTVDPWALRSIHVERGPGSVFYGSGAMGGVILLQPELLPEETFGEARVAYESADTSAGAMVEAGSKVGAFSGRAGATYRRNGQLRVGSNGGDFFFTGLEGDEFLAAPYDEGFWRAAAGFDAGDHLLRANYFGGFVDDAMRIDRLGSGEVRVYDNEDHLSYLTYALDGPAWVDNLRVNASWHRTVEDIRRRNCLTVPISIPDADSELQRVSNVSGCVAGEERLLQRVRTSRDLVDTFGASATGLSSLLGTDLSVLWGADAYTDFVQSEGSDARAPDFEAVDGRGNFADGSTYRTVGIFGQGRYALWASGPHLLRAELGGRVENFAAHAPDVTDSLGDVDYSFTGLVGSAALAYLNGTFLHTYLSWNQGFRAPNLQETTVLGDSGNFYEVPNPDLGPERSDTFELGAKVDIPNAIRLEPSLWASLLSDRITREPTTFDGFSEIDGKAVRHRINRDSAYFYGFDIGAETTRWSGVSFFGNLSWIDGAVQADEEDPTFLKGPFHDLFARGEAHQNPRRLPPLQYLGGLRFEPGEHWYFAFFLQGAGAQDKLAPDDRLDKRICEAAVGVLFEELGRSCPGTAGWTTLNARAGYMRDGMTIDLGALNLTDERYRLHGSGVPAPGINLAAQLTLEY